MVHKILPEREFGLGRNELSTYIPVYHPQSNMAKRVMKELGQIFKTYNKHTTLREYIQLTETWLNNNKHESIGLAPIKLIGRKS